MIFFYSNRGYFTKRTVQPIVLRTSQSDPTTWATAIIAFLSNNFVTTEERLKELKPVSDLASEMLTHLLIASMAHQPLP